MPIKVHVEKVVPVSLVANPQIVIVGEPVYLTATVAKKASSYNISWDGITEKTGVMYEKDTGNYVTTATFIPSSPGSYIISFSITMGTGEGAFHGYQSITITVN